MRALGFKTVPVTAVGERAVQGFNVRALRGLIGMSADAGRSISPDELLGKYRLVFKAATRAILQIPEDQLDWVTPAPGYEPTLRQFTWHIFDRAEVFAGLAHGGEFTEDMAYDHMTRANACRTTNEIAAYGEQVLAQVEEVLTHRRELLEKSVNTYFGTSTIFDLLIRALSMAVFRLKGTYRYLEMLGVAPLAPLGYDDFVGIPIPSGTP